jgi:hypothetical protein
MPRRGKTIDRTKGEIVFPATRGGYMLRSTWCNLWHSVRASAGMPGQEFYELKHRAIQWMVDPVEDGGLGLDPATVAEMVGHDDGGYLIATATPSSAGAARSRAHNARWTTTSSEPRPPPRLAAYTSSNRRRRRPRARLLQPSNASGVQNPGSKWRVAPLKRAKPSRSGKSLRSL